MLNWQNIIVALIVLAASLYVAQRVVERLRSLLASKGRDSSCATGCGSCGEGRKEATTPRTVFVEIGRSRTPSRRETR